MSELNNCCGTTCNKQLAQSEFIALQKDRDARAELSARLFSENERLKHQLNLKQLEIQHCHTVCDELRQKLDALAAQVEAFGDKLIEVVALLDMDGMTVVQWLLDNCQEIESLTNTEPQQHLAEIRAQAGRDGFIAGSEQTAQFITGEIGYAVPLLEARANQYADKIRQEGN